MRLDLLRERERERRGLWQRPVPLRVLPRLHFLPPSTSTSPPAISTGAASGAGAGASPPASVASGAATSGAGAGAGAGATSPPSRAATSPPFIFLEREGERERDVLRQWPVRLLRFWCFLHLLRPPSISTSPPRILERILELMRDLTLRHLPVDLLRFWYFLHGFLAPASISPPSTSEAPPRTMRSLELRRRLAERERERDLFLQWPVARLRLW